MRKFARADQGAHTGNFEGFFMTFRQVLHIIAQRWYLVAGTLLLGMLIAFGYLHQQTPSYTSTATVRLNATGDTPFAGVNLDTDSETITAPVVLNVATKKLGLPAGALAGQVTTTVTQGTQTDRVDISATASSPVESQQRASAVAASWMQYLNGQLAAARDALLKQQKSTSEQINALQKQVQAHQTDQVAQTNLNSAIANLGQINSQLTTISTAGDPATLLSDALPGSSNGTPMSTILLAAAVAGLIAGIGVALIRDQFDGRLRDENDAVELTEVPLLGELAIERRRRKDDSSIPAAARQPTAFNEGIRALRTSLQVLLPASHATVVLTSPEPGDGKTFVAANLAVSWARTGRRIILVGGDLRRSRLEFYFGSAADGRGLADLLQAAQHHERTIDRATVEACLRETEFDGLRILPAGAVTADPADLLGNNALAAVVAILRELADVVLIDTPPALAMADAAILAPRADGVAVLATPRRTPRASLSEAVRIIEASGATVLGVVANRSRRRLPKSYRSYYLQHEVPDRTRQTEQNLTPDAPENAAAPKATPATPAATDPAARRRAVDGDAADIRRSAPNAVEMTIAGGNRTASRS